MVTVQFADVDVLVARVALLVEAHPDERVVVSIAGTPGLGKTTLATNVARGLAQVDIATVVLPMDGFHLYRRDLVTAEMVRRRGAPFTFDPHRLVEVVQQLKPAYAKHTVYLPLFDHRLKDPVENGIVIGPEVRVVLMEGLYLSLPDPVWTEVAGYCDDTWMVTADASVVLERLIARHLELGVAESYDDARERASGSDYDNAVYIAAHSKPTNVVVENNAALPD